LVLHGRIRRPAKQAIGLVASYRATEVCNSGVAIKMVQGTRPSHREGHTCELDLCPIVIPWIRISPSSPGIGIPVLHNIRQCGLVPDFSRPHEFAAQPRLVEPKSLPLRSIGQSHCAGELLASFRHRLTELQIDQG
jgi:hypothetical protein